MFSRYIPVLLLLGLSTSACSSLRATSNEAIDVNPELLPAIEDTLRAELQLWLGTPHSWGGTSQDGVDCSGLVHRIYADALGVSLPRTTDAQIEIGERIRRRELQTGDLVFFRPERKSDHVGLMLNNREFAHASSSRGVRISRIDNPYWDRWYRSGRRPSELSVVAQQLANADSVAVRGSTTHNHR